MGMGPQPQLADHLPMESAMRKIIESTLVSLDGVIGDPPVWAGAYLNELRAGGPDNKTQAGALARLAASDALLMGRRTYQAFAAVWPTQTGPYAEKLNSIHK